jgi:hypothetical protein
MSAAILAVSLSACESPELFKVNAEDIIDEDIVVTSQIDDTIQTVAETEATTEASIEYKTIDPPEDGWTLELLNEVFYLNGEKTELPFTLDKLGDGFEVIIIEENINNQTFYADVYYNDKKTFMIAAQYDENLFDQDIKDISKSKLSVMIVDTDINQTKLNLTEYIKINNIGIGSKYKDVIENLGTGYSNASDNSIQYLINDLENSSVIFATDKNTKLVNSIWITIAYEIRGE